MSEGETADGLRGTTQGSSRVVRQECSFCLVAVAAFPGRTLCVLGRASSLLFVFGFNSVSGSVSIAIAIDLGREEGTRDEREGKGNSKLETLTLALSHAKTGRKWEKNAIFGAEIIVKECKVFVFMSCAHSA